MKKKRLIYLLMGILLLLMTGCGKGTSSNHASVSDSQVKIYYTNATGTKMLYQTKQRSKETNKQLAAEQMLVWMKEEPESENYFVAIPSEVVINNVVARNNIVNIDFAVGYGNLDKAKDVICRAAIVKTLIQINGIDYVEFSIGGKTMMDADGTPIGSLTDSSFLFTTLPMEEKK